MLKKQLLEQNRILFDKLQTANISCERLRKEVSELKTKLIETSALLAQTEDRLAALQKDDSSIPSVLDEPQISQFPESTAEVSQEIIDESGADDAVSEPVALSAEMEYGSAAIGDIVLQATSFSNRLAESGKEDTKELLNLILGRTEVAKNEILNIITSEASLDAKKDMIDSQIQESVEYFKSVMEQ